MTAEVAILNKMGVALAADSTVTITTASGGKTYNTASKLFTLSKYHPIGIMIWNNTELNAVPFELIIKEFRDQLGKKSFRSVRGYADAFIQHLRTKAHVEKADQLDNFRHIVTDYCRSLHSEFVWECKERNIPFVGQLSTEARAIFDGMLKNFENNVKATRRSTSFIRYTPAALERQYPGETRRIAMAVFRLIKITPARLTRFFDLLRRAVLTDILSDDFTGIVVAGYGAAEHYPAFVAYQTDGIFANRLKLVFKGEENVRHGNDAILAPFAQRDAANLFMEGVDQSYQWLIDESLKELLSDVAGAAARFLGVTNQRRINSLRKSLVATAVSYSQDLRDARYEEVKRVLNAIMFLDKSEMAILAENIVSVTALKQKVSLDLETVGGPIDVAFISKNDGFIWIKRKHYFKPELNPFYFKKYLMEPTPRRQNSETRRSR